MNKYTLRQSPLALAIGSLAAAGPVHAATITVTTNIDAPVGTLPDQCTLRSAIVSANLPAAVDGCDAGAPGGNEIVFDAGLAHSTITLNQGEMEITRALTITGPAPGDPAGITIDGANASRLFSITGVAPGDFDVGLNNLTLTRGRTSADIEFGGAVNAYYANLLLDHVLVTGNSTAGYFSVGGGLRVRGDITLTSSTVSDNSTAGEYGGGAGLFVSYGDATLIGSTVSGNSSAAKSGRGGGLYLSHGHAMLTNSTVTGNSTVGEIAWGGGLHMTTGDVTLINSTISGNSTTGDRSYGGGLSVNNGNATLIGSTVSGNSTAGTTDGYGLTLSDGGGLRTGGGDLTLINTTVSGNSTSGERSHGGGLSVNDGEATLNYSIVSGNSTLGDSAYGGGIFVDAGTVRLTNSTLSGNSTAGQSADGGALYIPGGSHAFLTHVTVAFNTAASGTDGIHKYVDNVNPGGLSLFNSMVVQAGAGQTACNNAPTAVSHSLSTDANCTGTAIPLADIALGPLGGNGGPTLTHALGGNSVAIAAAGDCETDFNVTQDQRGLARPGIASAACDIGAFEFQGEDQIFRDRFEQ